MSRKLVDQDFLRGAKNGIILKSYLEDGNSVILSDYTAIESSRGDARINLRKSIETICNFPDQVVILKDTRDIILATNLRSVTIDDLIDFQATASVREIFRNIQVNDGLLAQNSESANEWFRIRQEDARQELSGLQSVKARYTNQELIQFRNWQTENRKLQQKIVSISLEDAVRVWHTHGYSSVAGEDFHANSFVFRYCLSGNLLRLKWITSGMNGEQFSRKVASDLTDATYYVLGTYFNGCLTGDLRSLEIQRKTIDCLAVCFNGPNFMGAVD